jgi:hypothetical protein
LAGDQRITHHPRLREPGQRVIDRSVAVRVILTHHVADHAGTLVPTPIRPVAAVVHGIEDPAVNRLEPVPDLG